jgi:hypothetical protein
MSYREIYIRDQAGRIGNRLVGSADAGISTVPVGISAVQLVDSNATRRVLWLANKGASPVWLGPDSNVTSGATGENFTSISGGNNRDIEYYTGEVWGVAGVSGSFAYIGVADIG